MERNKIRFVYLILINLFAILTCVASAIFFFNIFGLIILSNKELLFLYMSNPADAFLFLIGYYLTSIVLGVIVGSRLYKIVYFEPKKKKKQGLNL